MVTINQTSERQDVTFIRPAPLPVRPRDTVLDDRLVSVGALSLRPDEIMSAATDPDGIRIADMAVDAIRRKLEPAWGAVPIVDADAAG